MGYYMRFITLDEREMNLGEIETALKEIDENYKIDRDEENDDEGVLIFGDDDFGQLQINAKGDEYFDDDIELLIERATESEGENKQKVLDFLIQAKNMLFLRVLFQGRNEEETFEKIDPMWEWLGENRGGLIHADYEGFYDSSGLILETD